MSMSLATEILKIKNKPAKNKIICKKIKKDMKNEIIIRFSAISHIPIYNLISGCRIPENRERNFAAHLPAKKNKI